MKIVKSMKNNFPRHSCSFGDSYERAMNVRAKNMKPTGQIEQLTIAMFDGSTAGGGGYNEYLNGYVYIFYGWGNTKHRLSRGAGSSNVWLCDMITATPAQQNNYYELEARWLDTDKTDSDNLFGLVDGEIPAGPEARDGEYTSGTYLGFASWSNAEWRIDRVYVRKCLAVEPAAEISGTFERPSNPASTPTPLTTSFEYDDYNKLTEITNPDSATETLSYDDNGQLVKSEKSTGGGGGSPIEVTAYEWNDQGMLVKVVLPNGEPVEYFYDGNQRLISRKSSDGVDNFVQSGWDIMTKTDDLGKRTYYTGSSAIEDRESVKYFHYNHRGDTVLATDSEGNILNNFSYEAYGKVTNSEGIPVNNLSIKNFPNLFVGGSGIRYDTKTDLHYMRFRWFSSSQLRFISADLLMDLNRYAYVEENPVTRIDPLGLMEEAYIEYERNGIPVKIPIDFKSSWITNRIEDGTYKRYPKKVFQRYDALKNNKQYKQSYDELYFGKDNKWDRSKHGLFEITSWEDYEGLAIEEDRETQNCRMFAVTAGIVGEMTPPDFNMFVNDNFNPVKTENELIPGDLISYDNGQHVAVVIGRGSNNEVVIIERDADYGIYVGSFASSKKYWHSASKFWRIKENAKINAWIKNGHQEFYVTNYKPFESLKYYCGANTKMEKLIKWYNERKKTQTKK